MNTPEDWSVVVQATALLIPLTLVLVAIASPRRAILASSATLGLSVLLAVLASVTPHAPLGTGKHLGVGVDLGTCVMLLLVNTIGWVIVRYSRTYLQGDPGLARYFRWLLLTMGAVTVLVLANNLLVLALAWTATSLALHQLLTFYSDRVVALVAAHKKFLVSRLADVCLLACVALVHGAVGSLDLDRIAAWVGAHPDLTPSMQLAAVLVVVAVALRSAQLPFHGWLTQVMEAPTPVSALLHAGIVNIGGFVLIRLSPLMAHAALAQLLLVVIGLTSTIVAALVMTTRVSVKVALAWSTCAQMGFMLVQCGLGLWDLALLHLVAHSLYKAHAFLSAGTAVDGFRLQTMVRRRPSPSLARLGLGVLLAAGASALCVALLWQLAWVTPSDLSVPLLAILVSFSLIPLLPEATAGFVSTAAAALRMIGVVLLYVGFHAAAGTLLPSRDPGSNALGWALCGVGLVGLFTVKTVLQVRPEGRLSRALYPWLFAGLYLDERFTRVTFRIWPPRLTRRPETLDAMPSPLEAQA